MSTRSQWLIVAGVVAFLGGGLWFAATQLGDELFPIRIGGAAPDFTVRTLPRRGPHAAPAGATTTKGIADYKGEVVLLNVWATWCGPCRIEMPSIERLQKLLGPKGLRIVAVSVDDPGMEPRIEAFVEEFGLTFEVLHDWQTTIEQIYQTTGVPETFIIDREGKIRRRVVGGADWSDEKIVTFLERLLAEPRP